MGQIRGAGRIYQRGNRYWFSLWDRVQRKEVREPGGDTPQEAAEAMAARLTDMRQGTYKPGARRLTVADVLDAWDADLVERGAKAIETCRDRMNHLKAGLGRVKVADCYGNVPLFRRYIETRRKAGAADGTLNNEMGCLATAFRLAQREGSLVTPPYVPRPAASKARKVFLEVETFDAIHRHMAGVCAQIAEFEYLSGWRTNEVLGLGWPVVFLRDSEIRLLDSKNGDGRVLPLEGRLGEIVRARHAERVLHSPHVFHHKHGKPVSVAMFRQQWQAACTAEGLSGKRDGYTPHDFRRSFVRNAIRAGATKNTSKSLSGHRNDQIFDRYDIVDTRDMAAAQQLMALYLGARRSHSALTQASG